MIDLAVFLSCFNTVFSHPVSAMGWLTHHRIFTEEPLTLAQAGLSRFVTDCLEQGITEVDHCEAEKLLAAACTEERKVWGNGTRRRKVGRLQMGCEHFRSPEDALLRKEFMTSFVKVEKALGDSASQILDLTLDAVVAKSEALASGSKGRENKARTRKWNTGGEVLREMGLDSTPKNRMWLSRKKKDIAAAFEAAGL